MREDCRVQVTPGAAVFYSLLLFLDTGGWFTALLPGVLCHELGHLLALRFSGGRARRIRLEAAGLRMDVTPFRSVAQALVCTAAGPAAGLLWAAAAKAAGTVWGVKSAAAALVVNGFNLLPALPLDGGEMLLLLTGSRPLTLCCSWITAALMAAGFIKWRAWGLLVPTALIVKTALSS